MLNVLPRYAVEFDDDLIEKIKVIVHAIMVLLGHVHDPPLLPQMSVLQDKNSIHVQNDAHNLIQWL